MATICPHVIDMLPLLTLAGVLTLMSSSDSNFPCDLLFAHSILCNTAETDITTDGFALSIKFTQHVRRTKTMDQALSKHTDIVQVYVCIHHVRNLRVMSWTSLTALLLYQNQTLNAILLFWTHLRDDSMCEEDEEVDTNGKLVLLVGPRQ